MDIGAALLASGRSLNEVWRPAVGHEGEYEVSSWGRVWSIPRTIPYVDGRDRRIRGRIMKDVPDSHGYSLVTLGWRKVRVHVLVLEAFRGPRPKGAHSRHADDVSNHNALHNLSWGTPRDNRLDARRNGLDRNANKTECPQGHPYSPENTYISNRNGRDCKTCRMDYQRRYRAKKAGPKVAPTECVWGHSWAENARVRPSGKGRVCMACEKERAILRSGNRKANS